MKLFTNRLGLASALTALCMVSISSYSANQTQSQQAVGSVFWVTTATCPANAAVADGTLLPIDQSNDLLFSIIGASYGGNGKTSFKLPDLRGRTIVGSGTNATTGSTFAVAQTGGAESIQLSADQLPAHSHGLGTISMGIHATTESATSTAPTAYVAQAAVKNYTTKIAVADKVNMSVDYVNKQIHALNVGHIEGAGKPLSTRSPYLVLTPCIVMTGKFPRRG